MYRKKNWEEFPFLRLYNFALLYERNGLVLKLNMFYLFKVPFSYVENNELGGELSYAVAGGKVRQTDRRAEKHHFYLKSLTFYFFLST